MAWRPHINKTTHIVKKGTNFSDKINLFFIINIFFQKNKFFCDVYSPHKFLLKIMNPVIKNQTIKGALHSNIVFPFVIILVLQLKASEPKWVNSQNYYYGESRTQCKKSIVLMIFGVNLLFLGGFQLFSPDGGTRLRP